MEESPPFGLAEARVSPLRILTHVNSARLTHKPTQPDSFAIFGMCRPSPHAPECGERACPSTAKPSAQHPVPPPTRLLLSLQCFIDRASTLSVAAFRHNDSLLVGIRHSDCVESMRSLSQSADVPCFNRAATAFVPAIDIERSPPTSSKRFRCHPESGDQIPFTIRSSPGSKQP
ncbi:hypothetical protein NMY22_g9068 [Coprinellus aureogranulatus]|nr:hypothetical protein NMY22_g9068 [Coprinellus aureogranulatus]